MHEWSLPLHSDQDWLRELGVVDNQGILTMGDGCRGKNQAGLKKKHP